MQTDDEGVSDEGLFPSSVVAGDESASALALWRLCPPAYGLVSCAIKPRSLRRGWVALQQMTTYTDHRLLITIAATPHPCPFVCIHRYLKIVHLNRPARVIIMAL